MIVDTNGVIRGPAGDGRFASVARDDIADVTVSVLLGEDHSSVTYDISLKAPKTLKFCTSMPIITTDSDNP